MIGTAVLLGFTVTVGVIVAGFWIHPERPTIDRRSQFLGVVHVVGAAATVAVWVAYLVARDETVGGAALLAMLVTAFLGMTTWLSTRQRDRIAPYVNRPDAVPGAALLIHGAAAAAAILFAIAAIG